MARSSGNVPSISRASSSTDCLPKKPCCFENNSQLSCFRQRTPPNRKISHEVWKMFLHKHNSSFKGSDYMIKPVIFSPLANMNHDILLGGDDGIPMSRLVDSTSSPGESGTPISRLTDWACTLENETNGYQKMMLLKMYFLLNTASFGI